MDGPKMEGSLKMEVLKNKDHYTALEELNILIRI